MNFLFDLTATQPNSDGDFHGGGKYAKKVYYSILNRNRSLHHVYGLYDSSKKLDPQIQEESKKNNIELLDVRSCGLRELFYSNRIDRFYSALPFNIAYNFTEVLEYDCEIYGTIHGLRALETSMTLEDLKYYSSIASKFKPLLKIILKDHFKKKEGLHYQKLLEKINVVTVSEHTKYSIMSYFPKGNNDNIRVFYSPDVTDFSPEEHINDDNLMDEYFLLVSGNRWIKNNIRSAIALDQLFTERSDIEKNVIITGVTNEQVYLSKIKNKHRFKFYKYVDEAFLAKLYRNAFSFLYMTLNEGFGYPPLEAMKYGTPVITSPFTSINEICGGAVLYSNPFSVYEIKNRVLQLFDKERYRMLEAKGQEQYKYIKAKQDRDLTDLADYLLS